MYVKFDEIEYETVFTSTPCKSCNDDLRKCDGRCSGSSSWSLKRRPQEEIDRIRAEITLRQEDEILEKAEAIRKRRALENR